MDTPTVAISWSIACISSGLPTAVRNGKTNVYINGTKISTFDSGDVNLPYKYLTLGDLRVGRNLKFEGKIYDFTLFGTELTDEQIQNNYKKSAAYNNNW